MQRLDSLSDMAETAVKDSNRTQLVYFYAAVVLIPVVCYRQFEFLLADFWFVDDWISKGPLSWLIALFVIHRDLARNRSRRGITGSHVLASAVCLGVVISVSFYHPILLPALLLVLAYYLNSERPDPARILVVFLLLVFSLPYFSKLVPVLQWVTVGVTENLLGLAGIPTLVQANYIAIPGGRFLVEEGCSGYSFLASNLLLLFLLSLMARFNWRQFLLGLGLSVLMALLVNWIRVVLIILFAHNFGVAHDFVSDHYTFGWIVYTIFLLPYFYLMLKIDRGFRTQAKKPESKREPMLPYPAGILVLPSLLVAASAQWLIPG